MFIKEKHTKGIVFIVMTVIMSLLAVFIVRNSEESIEPERTKALAEFYNSEEVELALFHNLSNKVENATDVFIRWWKQPESSNYYFFLPKGLNGKELYWIFSDDIDVFVENEKIEEYEEFDLEEGKYNLRIVKDSIESECTLEVRFSSAVATFFLETQSGNLNYLHESKENWETAKYSLLGEDGKLENAGSVRNIRGRGNASWTNTEKKSYQITLEDKANLLGMPESRKWLLISNAFDDTFTRNEVAYTISEDLGFAYTPETEYIELYANGEYLGLYSLTEKIEIDNNRVAIRDLEKETEAMNEGIALSEYEFFMEDPGRLFSVKGYRIPAQPEDISGGYLLELELLDRYGLEASGFITSRMQGVVFNSPKYASYEQAVYVAERYQDFEDAMYSEDGYSPYTGKHYSEYIDVDSFARKYLLEELAKNLDASYTSQFFYKPEESVSDKFFAGPVWDYDKAIAGYGVTEAGIDLHIPEQIYAASEKDPGDIWYGLCGQDSFMEVVKEAYVSILRESVDRIAKEEIPQIKELIYESVESNMIRWNGYAQFETIEEKMMYYDEKIQEQSDFLINRMAFLAKEWDLEEVYE